MVDGGNPVMKAWTISSKGAVSDGGGQNPVRGYSVIKADDHARRSSCIATDRVNLNAAPCLKR